MKDTHQKHPPLTKPYKGIWARNEWAFYGAPCSTINTLINGLFDIFKDKHIAIIDADHKLKNEAYKVINKELRISHSFPKELNDYDNKLSLDFSDICLLNGNHYPADKQIVIIDKSKEESLKRRLPQLNNVKLLIRIDDSQVYPWLQEIIDINCPQVHILALQDISGLILAEFQKNIPPIKALILAGGKSSRMGKDKSQLKIHGIPQELHLAQICDRIGLPCYISKRKSDKTHIERYEVLEDRFKNLGPFGAICSALMSDPNSAWLVLACDLPFIDQAILRKLIDNRNPSLYATALKSTEKPFPEPLMTIYEPRSYQRLLQFLSLGYSCPRKMLINSPIETLEISDNKIFVNLNTPQDLEKI